MITLTIGRHGGGLLVDPSDHPDSVLQVGVSEAHALSDAEVLAAADLRRKRRVRSTEPIPVNVLSDAASPEVETDRILFSAQLEAALAKLPERQRAAVVLFDAEGYAHADIATMLGVPEGTVRSDVFHARRALRQSLSAFKEVEE